MTRESVDGARENGCSARLLCRRAEPDRPRTHDPPRRAWHSHHARCASTSTGFAREIARRPYRTGLSHAAYPWHHDHTASRAAGHGPPPSRPPCASRAPAASRQHGAVVPRQSPTPPAQPPPPVAKARDAPRRPAVARSCASSPSNARGASRARPPVYRQARAPAPAPPARSRGRADGPSRRCASWRGARARITRPRGLGLDGPRLGRRRRRAPRAGKPGGSGRSGRRGGLCGRGCEDRTGRRLCGATREAPRRRRTGRPDCAMGMADEVCAGGFRPLWRGGFGALHIVPVATHRTHHLSPPQRPAARPRAACGQRGVQSARLSCGQDTDAQSRTGRYCNSAKSQHVAKNAARHAALSPRRAWGFSSSDLRLCVVLTNEGS